MNQEDDELLTPSDIELIFAKAANFNSNGTNTNESSLDYNQFIFGLELAAMKIYGYSPESFSMLVNDFILPLKDEIDNEVNSNTEHMLHLMEMLKDEEMVNLLELVHQTLYPYFNFYSNENGLLDMQSFAQFWEDFKIFPDILPEAVVMNFFKTMSNFFQSNEEEGEYNSSECQIDEHLFVEVLALSALEMKFQDPQPTQIEKVIVLLDRMNNSSGPKRMLDDSGNEDPSEHDLLSIIKQAYPHLFNDS